MDTKTGHSKVHHRGIRLIRWEKDETSNLFVESVSLYIIQ